MPLKICNKCKREFPATLEYFYKEKLGKNGLRSHCKECRKESKKNHYLNNKNKAREYQLKNAEKISLYQKNRREIGRLYEKKYRLTHKEKIRAKDRKYEIKKYRTDIKEKISHLMSHRIWEGLKAKKGGHRWQDLVGYNAEDLKKHLESQFKNDMNWENHSLFGWHIDHIIPISSFNYSSFEDEDFKRCWALKNLQPLWGIDNIMKSNKMI